ncbi:hypothetical protein E1B28_008428 [Marasmius oreades]|uniref:2,3-bisphosphoglycerate-independent phosphoglycerate mutase n=1 Tax=Marasmius oreades TaxID=181124 RepID=A0A9P7RZ26_9AGAR|nr:uncharacterized protein E1B28_008428 [Marasmius oreades]KAG7092047.1 hypothetical protein E1B28_008428 [Marasmius oreades]
MSPVKNKVCLIVHDGWGHNDKSGGKGDAIHAADTTNMDTISNNHNVRNLAAHGTAVGLSDGLMGNSEVGHLNIGAGRIVWQDIVKIDVSIKKKEFHKNKTILQSIQHAKDGNGRLHFLGLISDGGVHSHINHLYALLETAKEQKVPNVYVHFFGDGRDTAPRSSAKYAQDLLDFIKNELGDYAQLATIVGRYYAMDRDKRWERIKIAVDALVKGEGESNSAVVDAIKASYDKDITDEFLKPIIVNGEEGRIKDGDTLFFFNYRSDRMREIVSVFGLPDKPMKIDVPKDLHITTMSRYSVDYPFSVAFPPQVMDNVLAEWLSKQNLAQAHVAETEKYAHVTFFFNGGVEKQFPKEDRFMIPSPKVPTYDKDPGMSVLGVAEKVAELVKEDKHDFVMCNFAPPDMVGHTGVYDAAVEAVTKTDEAVGVVYKACKEKGYVLVITSDHGNAEKMINEETGDPHTAHTTNPVPLIITGDKDKFKMIEDKEDEEGGALCDVAPTLLDIMGIPKPEEMEGRSLLKKD